MRMVMKLMSEVTGWSINSLGMTHRSLYGIPETCALNRIENKEFPYTAASPIRCEANTNKFVYNKISSE